MYETFAVMTSLKSVQSIGSDREISPLEDPSLTIFLKNNYRVISNKDILGHSIAITPYPESDAQPSYETTAGNAITPRQQEAGIASTYVKNFQGKQTALTQEAFYKEVAPILGEDVYTFLQMRHAGVAMLQLFAS